VRAYATNCAGTAYGSQVSFTTAATSQGVPCPGVPTLTDIDGNTYNTVQIGTQCWTKENLRVTKYGDGSVIPLDATGGVSGSGTGNTWRRTTGTRTVYGHNESNLTTYGFLYNWYAAKDNRGLCPAGWHVPTNGEWTTLTTHLGGESIAGGKMKSMGTTLWRAPNTGATNESGFSGLPGGLRNDAGEFSGLGESGVWWSSAELDVNGAKALILGILNINVFRGGFYEGNGASVRCLRDTVSISSKTVPTISTTAVDSIKTTTAHSGGSVTSDGGCTITSRGVVWSTSQNPTISLSTKTSDGTGTGSFSSNLTGLIANTTYYVRAYATNCSGTAYGSEVSFTTTAATTLPTLTTTAADSIKTTSARSGGNITSDGGCTITARGVVWSTSQNPTIALSTNTSDGTGTGSFSSNLTCLNPNTTYYVRSYATNCLGTAYGNEVSFTTTVASQGVSCLGVPTVTDIDGNTYNTVQIGTQCWTKENLRVTKYSDGAIIPLDTSGGTVGNGSGETWLNRFSGARTIYAHSQSDLATYGYLYNWYAAKGIATSGSTSYKNLCPSGWHVPTEEEWTTVITHLGGENLAGGKMKSTGTSLWISPNGGASNESGFTGLPGGNRANNGWFGSLGYSGLWWSSSEDKYISLYFEGCFVRKGSFTGGHSNGFSIRCLKDTVSTPSPTVPTMTTTAVDSIKTTSARSGGNITSDGGCTITARGVVWSTSQNPTISLSTKSSEGPGTGSFTSNLTGLTAYTTYYVRAYATNCAGTAYGSQVSFTTTAASQGVPCPGVPTVSDIDGNTYNTVQIGTQCWTKENLRVTKYSDGTSIPLDSSGGTAGNGLGQTWGSRTTGARTIYEHSASNLTTYGYLYNWYAAFDLKGLCPVGWHVPSDSEWIKIEDFLGGSIAANNKMKEKGSNYWLGTNVDVTNESGFTALPGGYRHPTGSGSAIGFDFLGRRTWYWSSSGYFSVSEGNLGTSLNNNIDGLSFESGSIKKLGVSVRCIKDSVSTPSTTLPTLSTTAVDSIKTTTARSGGNITSDGGCTITVRGVVWSTSQNPTISSSTKTSEGTGTGSFTSNLTGLTANTTYYVRAYATNCSGTAYGS
jgi:uncharacterized protein (TIGR02145 family)